MIEKSIEDSTFDENIDYIIQNIKHSHFVEDSQNYLIEVMEYIRLGNPKQIPEPKCVRQKPWKDQPYRKVNGQYMPNIIVLDEVTNDFLETYYEPRGSSDESSHEYTYNGTTIRWLKREFQ